MENFLSVSLLSVTNKIYVVDIGKVTCLLAKFMILRLPEL